MIDIECLYCGDTIPGQTLGEAVEDALNLGWEVKGLGKLVCAACLDEEAIV